MATYREASPEQAAFLTSLIDAGLLLDTGAPGLLGQGPAFDDVREAFTAAVTRTSGSDPVEAMRFPPLTSTFEIEKNGYLSSFPTWRGVSSPSRGTTPRRSSSKGARRATKTGASSSPRPTRSSSLRPATPSIRRSPGVAPSLGTA